MLTRYLTIVALLLLSACSPFTQKTLSTAKLPDSYQQATSPQAEPLPERWWESFADDNLNQLQERMLAKNLDLRQTLHRLEQLEALERSSAASLWPSLSLNGSASRDKAPTATGSSRSDNFRLSLAASYEVDLWNRLQNKEQAATLRREAGEKETQTLLLSLTAQLTESYFLLIEQRLQLQLLEQQIERNRQLLLNSTGRYRAGLASSESIYQAQQSLATQQARKPQLQSVLTQVGNKIALLLGEFAGEDVTAATDLPQLAALPAVGLPADLLTKRPDIAAALLQLQATDQELAAALAAQLPAINLTASLGRSTTRLATGDIEGAFWNLAASLAQPLIDGGRRQAEVDRQQAVRKEQLAGIQKTLLTAVTEVENALNAEQNSALRATRLEQQLQISNQTLALARDNYRSGLINSSTVLTTELEHASILSQSLNNQREWLSNRISLARALGGQWMTEELNRQRQALTATEDH